MNRDVWFTPFDSDVLGQHGLEARRLYHFAPGGVPKTPAVPIEFIWQVRGDYDTHLSPEVGLAPHNLRMSIPMRFGSFSGGDDDKHWGLVVPNTVIIN